MAKFRKKPVVIEAFQWNGTNVQALADWAAQADLANRKARNMSPPPSGVVEMPLHVTAMGDHITLEVTTLEGDVTASPGDWIICGVQGEFYPCKPDIFAATYEAVTRPHYPPGMGEESRRLHREYNALVEAQRNGANNIRAVVRLTDECNAKGIILVPGGENL